MAATDWFRPPRSVLTLYLAGSLTAMAGLTWLAFRQVNSDELAEAERTRQRLAAVADRVSVRVQQGLGDLERALSGGGSGLPDHAVVVRGDEAVITVERGTLPFVPVAPRPALFFSDAFTAAESAEDAGDSTRAADAYRQVAAAGSRDVQSRALVGLGRVLRKSGRHAEALEAYATLARMGDVVIEGRPADLIARIGVCRALKEGGQHQAFVRETAALRSDLTNGRWPITGAVWYAVYNDTSAGTNAAPSPAGEWNTRVAAAEALQSFWQRADPGPQLVSSEAGAALVVSARDESAIRAVVIGSDWLVGLWRPIALDADVDVALIDRDGTSLLGRTNATSVTLAAADTGLPWTIAVSDAHPERGLSEATARRRTFLVASGDAVMRRLLLAVNALAVASACASGPALGPVPLGLDLYTPAPQSNPPTTAKIHLGRRLFHDRRLSADGSIACASCHDPERGFSQARAIAIGVRGRTGRRNAPALINRAWGQAFFWDGRITTLEEQVLRPIEDPNEMGSSTAAAARRVGLSARLLADALATYLRSIRSGGSPFDRFERGDASALSGDARAGLLIFRGKGGCARCHIGPSLTDEEFHNTGVAWAPGFPGFRTDGRFLDAGRAMVTGRDRDRGKFKTPTLREVARTSPYMHDGSLATLEDVVDFYNGGGRPNPNRDIGIRSLELTAAEKQGLVAFLRSLSGIVTEGPVR